MGRRRLLGRRGAGQPRRAAAPPRRGGVRVQVLSAALRGGRVPTSRTGRARARDGGRSPPSTGCSWSTPRTRRRSSGPRLRPAAAQGRRYGDFLASRPREAENVAVGHVIDLARHTGCRVHVLHVSSAEALPLIAAAKHEGIRVTAETCPHYLYFADEEVPEGGDAVQVLPTDPRGRQQGARSGTGWVRASSTSSCPITRRRRRSSRRWTQVTSASRGEGSARCSSGSRSCGPRRGSGVSASPT